MTSPTLRKPLDDILRHVEQRELTRVGDVVRSRVTTLLKLGAIDDSVWIDKHILMLRREADNESNHNSLTVVVLDLSAEDAELPENRLAKLVRLSTVASRVAAAALSNADNVIALYLWAVGPAGADDCPVWGAFRARVRCEETSCAKDVWLPALNCEMWDGQLQRFIASGPLARPWQRGAISSSDESDMLDLRDRLYGGPDTTELVGNNTRLLDQALRKCGGDKAAPDVLLDELLAIVTDREDEL